ncbi:hypothetical protein DFQ30_000809 [Apophysomyces sp. BC1015]|nr:hypothetical protein DFQ30_000809 [Apophysomyces sp. BC1015]
MRALNVFRDGRIVGSLFDVEGELGFAYAASWINAGGPPLSPDLPLPSNAQANDTFSDASTRTFFDNLLPEGTIRAFIAQALKISPDNVFGLLERFGGDTAGAYSILPIGDAPSDEPRYVPIGAEQLAAWFSESRGVPLMLEEGAARMSLSGAQDKITVYISDDDKMALPLADAPSSHIIKPAISYRSDLPASAANEVYVMRLAAASGLQVPVVRFDAELNAAIIARYDRYWKPDGRLGRLHQVDLCQAMGLPSSRKYEAEGGPAFADCLRYVTGNSSAPVADGRRMLGWLAFNLIVGNMDSHAKNLSMLYDPEDEERPKLAPFYDILSTTIYPQLSTRFAFRIGGEDRPEWIMERHWARFARDTRLSLHYVKHIVSSTAKSVQQALPTVHESMLREISGEADAKMLSKIHDHIDKQAKVLLARITAPSPKT